MKSLKNIVLACCTAAAGLLALSSCEGSDLYGVDSPDWIQSKIDSINNANKPQEDVLVGMQEDVYTIGKTDYTTGFWTAFSKYYVVPDGKKWNAVFNLNLNPSDNVYYKNFALIITNDNDRGATDYQEYGAFRFDATGDSAKYNSQWGNHLWFKYTNSNLLLNPDADNKDANVQKLGGKITLTVDRSRKDTFYIKLTNGTVTKTYTQPFKLANLNKDASDTNIRCFLVPEGSYIDFLQTNIDPIGGRTSAKDKNPVSMVLNNVPEEVDLGTDLNKAMENVSATVTYDEGVTKTIPASELYFSAINDMNVPGEKTLTVIYNKTFKGENAATPIVAYVKFKVVQAIKSIKVTTQPTRKTYYYYTSAATEGMGDRTMAFDPTGMVVTATYNNGETGVVDNSKLKFSAIPVSAGTKAVTISTENGKTAKVSVTLKASSCTAVTPTPTTLGSTDNTTAWWTAFTNDMKVPAGETRSVTFTNYCGASNWNNFVVILRNSALSEYGVVRADNYGWGNGYAAATLSGGQSDWASWLAAMNGSKVTVYVTNCNNGACDVQAVMHGTDGKTYYQYYLGLNTVDPSDLNFAFTVDNCHLVFGNSAAKRHYAHRR
ncbi:bacterial Ig-like domain-containing protein [Prevotella sp. AGR2160]|uniref:bacterial Ig-like domain-containing protein n=1 Tax=Prevotella sp. AGR2160 TaxID=1280674 RepID=UPI000406D446|nr:bacterial Ig-like domain-containing protein [Prevotella sp. AGR2160]